MKRLWWLALLVGCKEPNPGYCTGHPGDPTCPDAGGTCAPGEFLGCADQDHAIVCPAAGMGSTMQACGGFGCNASAGRCNECTPSVASCSTDRSFVEQCTADGIRQTGEGCSPLPCVDGSSTTSAHCGYISPLWLPDICDTPATTMTGTLATMTIDTGTDTNCTQIVAQNNGPAICVVRFGSIMITGAITVTGTRPIAFVADRDLTVASSGGILGSASGGTPGPGGGSSFSGPPGSSGTTASGSLGGGGAGFFTAGAAGGGVTQGSGGAGGAASGASSRTYFAGGPGAASGAAMTGTLGGGGGGGVLLASCRGTVAVQGLISVGGGGGGAGRDTNQNTGQTSFVAGGGGGAGGYVVIEGVDVDVPGSLFAEGGGGGGGCTVDNAHGSAGADGAQLAPQGGAGGVGNGTGAGAGGAGGGTLTPIPGFASTTSAGGGGGAGGFIETYTPTGHARSGNPAGISPSLSPNGTIPTR